MTLIEALGNTNLKKLKVGFYLNEYGIIKNFTHKSQEGFEFSQHHGAIFIFVVQFAQFNKVVVVSSMFRLLNNLLGKSDNLIEGKEFLFNIISLAVFDASLLGEVHAHSVEDIHEVVHVKDTLAVPIVDVADPLNFFNVLFFSKYKRTKSKQGHTVEFSLFTFSIVKYIVLCLEIIEQDL